MSALCITSRLTLGPIARGALSELALNYNLRAEITASPAYGNGRFVGIPTTERNSLRLFEGDGFQLKRTVGVTQVDLRSAAQCVVDSLTTSGAPKDLVKKLEDTLKVIDYVRASGDVITAAKISEGTTAEQATLDAHNIALTLENALLLTVEDTTVWGQVMPSAAFEVLGKKQECPDKSQEIADARAAGEKAGKEAGIKEGKATTKPTGDPRYGEGERAEGRRAPEGGGKTGGGGNTDEEGGLGLIVGGAVGIAGLAVGGLALFLRRKDRLAHERQIQESTVTFPEPGAVTVIPNADGSRSFLAWNADDQGNRWSIRAKPYTEAEVSTLLGNSQRAIGQIDPGTNNPKDQVSLRVARGYVAQFTRFFPATP